MKRYMDPEMEVVSFEITDVTNGKGIGDENPISAPDDFWGNIQIDW